MMKILMIMRTMIYKAVITVAAIVMSVMCWSCSEDEMDRINEYTSNPPVDVIDGRLMLTNAIVATGFTTVSGDYSYYTSVYTEQIFGTGNNVLCEAELRQLSTVAGSATFNNVWNNTYATLLNLKCIMDKCVPGGINEGQRDLLGMAQVLAAINWGVLTDMHGDIPCSQALQGGYLKQPALDAQESVYAHIFNLLDEAVGNLEAAVDADMNNVGIQDVLYGSDNAKWLAAAHAVRARYKLHMMVRDDSAADAALAEARKALDLGFGGMTLNVYDGTDTRMSPWAAFQYSRSYCACSTTVKTMLEQRADPRAAIYIYYYSGVDGVQLPASDAPVCGVPGDESMAHRADASSLSAPKWLARDSRKSFPMFPAASTNILSEAEVRFIIAELLARRGDDCTEALTDALVASFADTEAFGRIDMSPADYAASLGARLAADAVREVMVQKYLSQCRNEQVETYNDLRRCKALGEEYVTMTNPKNHNGSSSRWPLCLPYGSSGVSSNAHVREAYGDGLYVFSRPVWVFSSDR